MMSQGRERQNKSERRTRRRRMGREKQMISKRGRKRRRRRRHSELKWIATLLSCYNVLQAFTETTSTH